MDQLWLWVGFNVFVLAMLAVDLFIFHKEAHEVHAREAATWSVWSGSRWRCCSAPGSTRFLGRDAGFGSSRRI